MPYTASTKNVNIWVQNYWYEALVPLSFIMFFFFSRMCVCLLLFHSLSVLWMFFSPSIQNFIDSLCRQSVDIGYYYYFGFVLHMACCELISIGYFFVCLSRISRSNTCSFHFKLEWCVCVCVCVTICRLLKNSSLEPNSITERKICQTLFPHKLPLLFEICFILPNGFSIIVKM